MVGYYCGKASDEADLVEGRPRLGEYVADLRERRKQQRLWGRLVGLVAEVWLWVLLIMGALSVSGIGMLLFPRYIGAGWGSLGSYPEGRLEVHPDILPKQQTCKVGLFLAWLGRIIRAGLFRGKVGGRAERMGLFDG
jgi:hypothetical protein